MAIRVVEFLNEGTKFLSFEFWICQKLPIFDFQNQFSMSKTIEEYQFRITFIVIDIFFDLIKSIFKYFYF